MGTPRVTRILLRFPQAGGFCRRRFRLTRMGWRTATPRLILKTLRHGRATPNVIPATTARDNVHPSCVTAALALAPGESTHVSAALWTVRMGRLTGAPRLALEPQGVLPCDSARSANFWQ